MLQLQLKSLLLKLPKKNIFFAKLLLFSFLVHGILFMLLISIQSFFSHESIRLSEISDGSTVIVLPLIKNVLPQNKQPVKKIIVPQQKQIPEKKVVPLPSKKIVQKKSTQAQSLPKTNKIIPKQLPKMQPKSGEKKSPLQKKQREKKNEILKEVPKKIESPPEIKKEMIIPQPIVNPSSALQEVGRHDLELIALCNEIKEGIAKKWKRPTNISSLIECHVKVCVHSESNRDVTITQSSQALALDIMVKNFVSTYPFPKAIWHKDIELIF